MKFCLQWCWISSGILKRTIKNIYIMTLLIFLLNTLRISDSKLLLIIQELHFYFCKLTADACINDKNKSK